MINNAKTKIAITVGQQTCDEISLISLVKSGACLFRYNLSAQLGLEEHLRRINIFKEVKSLYPHIKLMLDMPFPGAKVRIGMLPQPKHFVNKGDVYTFKSATESASIKDYIPVAIPMLGSLVKENQIITIGDGELKLKVIKLIDPDSFSAEMLTAHDIPCQKSLNLGFVNKQEDFNIQELSIFASKVKPDVIAFSFVEDNSHIENIFEIMGKAGLTRDKYLAFAKIESFDGIKNVNLFINNFDGLMVARGDLALNVDYCYLGEIQQYLIEVSRRQNKMCIVSTQVCESVSTGGIPNRSELVGVYSIAKSEVDYILLAKETSSLSLPNESVDVVRKIISSTSNPIFNYN